MEMTNVRGQEFGQSKQISIPYDDINYLKGMLFRLRNAWKSGDTIVLKHIFEVELPREINRKEGEKHE